MTGQSEHSAAADQPVEADGRLRDAWAHRELRWLLSHHAVAGVGQTFATVAIGVALYEQTGSGSWVAAAAAARLVPYLALAGVAGALADRIDRRRLLLWSAVGRAAVLAMLTIAVAFVAPPVVIVTLVLVATALGTGSFPALMAMLPSTVPNRDLVPASTLLNTVETAAWLIGPALGGLLLLDAVPVQAVAVNAIVFVAAAAFLMPTKPRPVTNRPMSRTRLRHDLRIGLEAVAGRPVARESLVLVAVVNVAVGAGPLAMLLASQRFAGASNAYAVMIFAAGAGGVVGIGATTRIVAAGHRIGLTAAALAALVPFLALAGADLALPWVAAAMAVGGAGAVATEVATLTLLLRSLPDEVAGRVFGLVDSLLVASVLLGSLMAPALVAIGGLTLLIGTVAIGLSAVALIGPRLAASPGRGKRRATTEAAVSVATVPTGM